MYKENQIEYTPTQQNIADLMTKQFTKQKINTFKNMLFDDLLSGDWMLGLLYMGSLHCIVSLKN